MADMKNQDGQTGESRRNGPRANSIECAHLDETPAAEAYPDGPKLQSPYLAGTEIEVAETIDIRDSPISEEEWVEIGQKVLDSPEQGSGSVEISVMFDGQQPGHVFPESTYVNHGSILCEDTTTVAPEKWMGPTYSTYYAMGPLLPNGFNLERLPISQIGGSIRASRMSDRKEYVDQDILDGFGAFRIPPRVAFKLAPAREAIGREITDFLREKHNEPPAMVGVSLIDSRFRTAPRVHATLAIKRNGTDSYKGRLCVRGDTAPLQTPEFGEMDLRNRFAVAVGGSRRRYFAGIFAVAKLEPQGSSNCHSPAHDSTSVGGRTSTEKSRSQSGGSPAWILVDTPIVWWKRCARALASSDVQTSARTWIRPK